MAIDVFDARFAQAIRPGAGSAARPSASTFAPTGLVALPPSQLADQTHVH
jgi:hypothetical protein